MSNLSGYRPETAILALGSDFFDVVAPAQFQRHGSGHGAAHPLLQGVAQRERLGAARRLVALDLLARIGLGDYARAHPDRLSGGQQQRAAIVRAIATDPEVLLLDEITSALDPELVGEVLELVRQLASDGRTILMATHEMAFARDVADRVVFLDQGVIVEQGTPAEVFGAPREARTRAFLSRFTG